MGFGAGFDDEKSAGSSSWEKSSTDGWAAGVKRIFLGRRVMSKTVSTVAVAFDEAWRGGLKVGLG